jgi:hypothetical protein
MSSEQAGRQVRALSTKLRGASKADLRKRLRQKVSAAGKPIVDEVKQAVRELQVTSSHGGGTAQRRKYNVSRAKATAKVTLEKARERAERRGAGLRETIAAGVRLQINASGIRFIASSARLPESQRTLPRHLDSEKGWRHPVFGNRDNWVTEHGGPWFAETIKPHAPDFRAAVVDAMEETKNMLQQ